MGAAGGAAPPTAEDGNGSTSAFADRDVIGNPMRCVDASSMGEPGAPPVRRAPHRRAAMR
jgi:hypothetical protein